MKLCHMMSVISAERNRPVKEKPKARLLNIVYFLKRDNVSIRVCQGLFRHVLGLTVHRLNHVAKVINQGEAPKEKRGGDHMSTKSVAKRKKVEDFIGQLRGQESHYNRSKSKRIYLPSYLNISKLHIKMYNEKVDAQYKVTYLMFRKVFVTKFNIGFSSPASDCCGQCTRLKHLTKIEKNPIKKK